MLHTVAAAATAAAAVRLVLRRIHTSWKRSHCYAISLRTVAAAQVQEKERLPGTESTDTGNTRPCQPT
jgi:hypothetical protein